MDKDLTSNYKLLTCFHCGNKGLLKIEYCRDSTYGDTTYDSYGKLIDFDPWETHKWYLLSCPVCAGVTLYHEYGDYGMPQFDEILYPNIKYDFQGLPMEVKAAFESALKVKNIDKAVCLLALRRTLEAICKDKGAEGEDLYTMVQDMIKKNILPKTFDDACWIIRKLGNNAAHADKSNFYDSQVERTIEFMQYIIEYLYTLPVKMNRMKNRIQQQLEEEKNQKTDK